MEAEEVQLLLRSMVNGIKDSLDATNDLINSLSSFYKGLEKDDYPMNVILDAGEYVDRATDQLRDLQQFVKEEDKCQTK